MGVESEQAVSFASVINIPESGKPETEEQHTESDHGEFVIISET